MDPQKPAEGISLTAKFEDSVFYRVDCQCGNPDDAIDFIVEIDSDVQQVTVSTHTTQKTPWWNEVVKPRYDIDNEFLQGVNWFWSGFINGLFTRLKLTWNVWVHGYVNYESYTCMNKQQATNYAHALANAVRELDKQLKTKGQK